MDNETLEVLKEISQHLNILRWLVSIIDGIIIGLMLGKL